MNRLEKFISMNRFLVFVFFALLLSYSVSGQRKKTEPTSSAPTASAFSEKIKGLKPYTGFLNYYYDEKNDKIFLSIESFDTEFLYIVSLPAGIGSNDIGLDRGQLGGERIVKFEKRGPKVLMIEPNYRYRAITNNIDERKAVEQAFAQSVLWGFTVVADEGGKVLVDATDFFLQDAHDVIGTLKATQQGSYGLDKSRSAFYS